MNYFLVILVAIAFLIVLYVILTGASLVTTDSAAEYAESFDISVGFKTENNSEQRSFGQGSPLAFFVDGEEAPTLNLRRNVKYRFNYSDPNANHPLYFTASNVGADARNALVGIAKYPLTKPTTVVFKNNLPNSFYYQCALHPQMGGHINLY